MPEWLIERGIGETRSLRVTQGSIVEARILIEGIVPAGSVLEARLKSSGRPAIALANGEEYLLPGGAPGMTEGSVLTIQIIRERIPGAEPWKRPLARVAAPDSSNDDSVEGELLPFPGADDRLADNGWLDLLEEARSGVIAFSGGQLRVSPTPAMTLIDVDGYLPPQQLAEAGAEAAARAILRHGIGGSIGLDLPTIAGKDQRRAVAERVDAVLQQSFERTSMNGFGFMQIVRPRRHASLFELAQDRAGFEARALLRSVALEHRGPVRLVVNPALARLLETKREWLDRLSTQLGGEVSLRPDTSRPISGGYAERS